jgi:hypothetical protein
MRQLPLMPLVNGSALVFALPHDIEKGGAGSNCACTGGSTVMILDCVHVRPHASVNNHDSVIFPPQMLDGDCVLRVEFTVPLIKQLPLELFENPRGLTEALPHATVIGFTGANTAGAEGSTVMFLD